MAQDSEMMEIIGAENFLTYENSTFTRLLHLSYVPSILGDKMSLEPRIPALVHCWKNDTATEMIRGKFTEQEWLFISKNT